MKFRNMVFPSGVKMDSGWNCTPKMGYSLCCTAITSPSVVRPAYELNMKPLCVPAALEEPEEPPITLEPSNLIVER